MKTGTSYGVKIKEFVKKENYTELSGTEWLFKKNTRNESHGGMALLWEAMGVQNKYNDRKN